LPEYITAQEWEAYTKKSEADTEKELMPEENDVQKGGGITPLHLRGQMRMRTPQGSCVLHSLIPAQSCPFQTLRFHEKELGSFIGSRFLQIMESRIRSVEFSKEIHI